MSRAGRYGSLSTGNAVLPRLADSVSVLPCEPQLRSNSKPLEALILRRLRSRVQPDPFLDTHVVDVDVSARLLPSDDPEPAANSRGVIGL